jgi:hypothetical protein
MNVSRLPNRGRLRRFGSHVGSGVGFVLAMLGFVLLVVIVGAWLIRFAAYSIGLAL